MRTAIVGCGAMGSVYAGRLARAGNPVLAVGRNVDHVDAIVAGGLRVTGPDGDHVVALRAVTGVPHETMELVVLAVKAADARTAARQAMPLVGPDTVVLTIQNGLGAADDVADVVGGLRLVVGVASGFGASLVEPGHVHHNAMRALHFGAYTALSHDDVERVAALWRGAGFDATAVVDIAAVQWTKLMCNAAYSGLAALTGLTVGQIMDDPELGPVSRAAAVETWRCAKALGVAVEGVQPIDLVRDFAAAMPAAKPSVLLDHEAGRPSEIDVINGAVPRQAAKVEMEAPVNATIAALVKARERGFGKGGRSA